MRYLYLILCLYCCACSSKTDVIEEDYEYQFFDHVEELTYPDALKKYAFNNPTFPFFSTSHPKSFIISRINSFKEDLGNYMEKVAPKYWWPEIDTVLVNQYGATTENSKMYLRYNRYYNTGFYFQITDTGETEYFFSIITNLNPYTNYQVARIDEMAWQDKEKTKGGIDRYYYPLTWEYSSDSLKIHEVQFNTYTKLNLSILDYSGRIEQLHSNDSIYYYNWDVNGNGSYLVKHKITGLSIKPEYFW